MRPQVTLYLREAPMSRTPRTHYRKCDQRPLRLRNKKLTQHNSSFNRCTTCAFELRKRGLRDRNSPTCTLSQNGYGDNICLQAERRAPSLHQAEPRAGKTIAKDMRYENRFLYDRARNVGPPNAVRVAPKQRAKASPRGGSSGRPLTNIPSRPFGYDQV